MLTLHTLDLTSTFFVQSLLQHTTVSYIQLYMKADLIISYQRKTLPKIPSFYNQRAEDFVHTPQFHEHVCQTAQTLSLVKVLQAKQRNMINKYQCFIPALWVSAMVILGTTM